MTRRKSRRRFRWRWRKIGQRRYESNRELHAYEEEIVMRELLARGGGSPEQWCREEPERWRKKRLQETFRRLCGKGQIDRAGRSVRRINHVVYVTTTYIASERAKVPS